MPRRKTCWFRSVYAAVTINAMNDPVFAALAPGVEVSGRIVSAISSSSATSAAVNVPMPCDGLLPLLPVEGKCQQRVAAHQRCTAERGSHAPDRLAARHA